MTDESTDRSLSILVVDDDAAVRELLAWMLEDAGHSAFEAPDGAEALAFLHRHGMVDVVLSDVNMPGMDGIELSRQISRLWPVIPVLLISGRPMPASSRPFLPKPFRWDTLARAIASLAGPSPTPHCV